MRKWRGFTWVILIVATLVAGCSSEPSQPAAAPTVTATPEGLVDECYQEQADLYREAAELAADGIRANLPKMMNAVADALGGDPSGRRRFNQAGDDFMAIGDDFRRQMDLAEGAC
jgi:hypothetical protein